MLPSLEQAAGIHVESQQKAPPGEEVAASGVKLARLGNQLEKMVRNHQV